MALFGFAAETIQDAISVQGPPETVLHWLYTNAPAAWISALVATVTVGFLLYSRKRPNRIVIREIRNTSVVRIRPSVRNKIKMTFDDKPIETLGQIEGEIVNDGSGVITTPKFVFTLAEDSIVLDALITPQDFGATAEIDRNTVTIALPYLNPVREDKQIVRLSLLVDGTTENIKTTGGGEGWSVWYLPVSNPKRELYWNIGFAVFVVFVLGMGPVCARHIQRTYGIPSEEISWRALVAALPGAIFAFLGVGVFLSRQRASSRP